MKNIRKLVALIIVLTVVMSALPAMANAEFTDVPKTADYAEAVSLICDLGIMSGYDDGTFRPEDTVTRAEAAAMIVKASGRTEMRGATVFCDVPADHPCAGYINTAYGTAIVCGSGDGTFAPDKEVTYEQFIKMIVSHLNYRDNGVKADSYGGYPSGYIALAEQYGITEGINGEVGRPVTRKMAAELLFNTLDVHEMFMYPGCLPYIEDRNILAQMDIDKLEVIVAEASVSDGITAVTLAAAKDYEEDHYSKYIIEDIDAGELFNVTFDEGNSGAAALVGQTCIAYVGVDKNTGKDTIFHITAIDD